MLRSKIVLDLRDIQSPERQHEVNIDTEHKDSQIRPELGQDLGHSEVEDGTGRCDLSFDSDSNNNQDESDIDLEGKEREANQSRMLSIPQKEKSRSSSLSSKTGGNFCFKQSLVSEGLLSEKVVNADKRHSRIKLSEPRSMRNRDNNDGNSPAKSSKSLKVIIKSDDVRLAKDAWAKHKRECLG